jgi:hypothetical protein
LTERIWKDFYITMTDIPGDYEVAPGIDILFTKVVSRISILA